MRKFVFGGAIAMAAAAAHAQSSVTLYGIVDVGLSYVNNAQTGRSSAGLRGAPQTALTDAHATGMSGSRWGLRGSEDLGGGLKALFVLENGFMVNNGTLAQGGAEFGRQAYVGLSSAAAGTVTAGRQYDPLADAIRATSAGMPHPRHAHAIAYAEAFDAGADFRYHTDDLVSRNERQLRMRQIAVDDVQIRAADATCAYVDQ
jgi:predicted porin